LWETVVDRRKLNDFFFVGFGGALELSFFERKRELADKEDSFDIAILLQRTRIVKNL
jgi:hypothetical protein